MAADPDTTGPAMLQQMFDAMPVGVAMFDRDLRVHQWNEAFHQFLANNEPARAAQLVEGAPLSQVSPFRIERAEALFQRALAGERVGRDAIPHVGPGGTTYWEIQLSPLLEDGEVIGVILTSTEATARVAAIEVLRQREDQFRKVFEEISDGVILNDFETGTVAEANPAVCRMHGYTREEFVGIDPLKFIHPDYWEALRDYQEAVRAGNDYYVRAKDVRKDGSAFDVEVMGTGFELEGKKYMLAVVRDISEQVALERERQQAHAMLEQRVDERTREISSLLDVSRALLSTLDLGQLFQRLLEQIESVIPYGGCSISILRDNRIEMTATRNVIDPEVSLSAVGMHFSVEDVPHLWGAMLAHRPLLIDDVYADFPEARDYRKAVGEHLFSTFRTVRSWLAVPLVHQGQVLGILSMSDNIPGAFTPSQARLAWANQAAVAVANARLYREVERRAREMGGLASIASALSLDQPTQDTLDLLAGRVMAASSAVASSITLFDPAGEFIACGVSGLAEGYVESMVEDWKDGAPSITRIAFNTGKRRILRQSRTRTLADPRYGRVHSYLRDAVWEGVVITPMVSRGRAQGTLDTYYLPGYEPDDEELQLLSAIANQVAVAVENIRLFEASQQRVREMDALYRADERLHQWLVLEEVLQALTDAAVEVLGADSGAVMVFDETPPYLLRLRTASGLSADQFDHLGRTLNSLETSGIRELNVPRVVPDTQNDVRIVQDIITA
ncbi:MAG TPA: PAS domain S-box protein, partial [Tepidiformaceae bacterium]|nr:PAS domain S-box protein [Tepidiformaceae bacterium]